MVRTRRLTRTLILSVVLSTGWLAPAAAGTLRVLFVGNSLTYSNDLPEMVAALSRGGGVRIETGMIATPDAALEDHWADGRVRQEFASKRWDVVVMQQGPSSLASSRANLVKWAGRLADEARAAGLRPALMTVWPPNARRAYMTEVIESYRTAAEACRCELLPAGLAWHEAWQRSWDLRLYGPDGFHPSVEGSFLAALVVWAGLTSTDPAIATAAVELDGGEHLRIDESRVRLYRAAAAAALAAR